MGLRYIALIYGIVFTVVGIASFLPFLLAPYGVGDPSLAVEAGRLFGLFPVNVLHNLVHLAFGIWGLLVWRSMPKSRAYAKAVAVIHAIFVVMGFLPALRTTFGLVPLHSHDTWLHILLAGGAAYFAWGYHPETAAHDRARI